jgi:hypothetical protein
MRVITVEAESSSTRWVLWGLTGAVAGIAAGVLVSEKLSGRAGGARTLWRRARSLAKVAGTQWLPWLEMALELKERWVDGDLLDEEEEEDEEDEFDDDAGDEDVEIESSTGDNGEADDETADDHESDVIGERVLVAFQNDPVLAERAVEIDADPAGGVFLHGRVWTAGEVAHAVTIAGGVPGVKSVRQRLRVRNRR